LFFEQAFFHSIVFVNSNILIGYGRRPLFEKMQQFCGFYIPFGYVIIISPSHLIVPFYPDEEKIS